MTPPQRFAASTTGVQTRYEEYVRQYGEPQWVDSSDFDDYPQADMVVGFSYAKHGSTVLLIDVAGEYIPVGEGSNWVAD